MSTVSMQLLRWQAL